MSNQERKKAWIEALRSGDFSQCRFVLQDSVGFCCIGVYFHAVLSLAKGDYIRGERCFPKLDSWRAPLISIGLTETQIDHLVDMNDNGKSFSEIADYIEGL